jgi:hypothetical protein
MEKSVGHGLKHGNCPYRNHRMRRLIERFEVCPRCCYVQERRRPIKDIDLNLENIDEETP